MNERLCFPLKVSPIVFAVALCSFVAVAQETITNVMSPVVKYTYLESLGYDTTAQPMSPVAKYIYFEWPGDDVLQVMASAQTDYFYETGPAADPLIVDATVTPPVQPQDPHVFSFDFESLPVYRYLVQFKNSLADLVWKWKQIIRGDGQTKTFSEDANEPGGIYRVGRFSSGFLSFPIKGLTPWTANISAVFDHSQPIGCADGVVTAFTGETGMIGFGRSLWFAPGESQSCAADRLYGFPNAPSDTRTKFVATGNYTGGAPAPPDGNDSAFFLFYDGHTGHDFPYDQTYEVVAAAAGVLHKTGDSFNAIWIDHRNGYSTWYLHIHPADTASLQDGANVSEGQDLGFCGSYGTSGNHLHFTVKKNGVRVDPYGWSGAPGQDPWPIDGQDNVILWKD